MHRHRDTVVLDGEIRARVVVAADGAYSVLRRAAGVPMPTGRARALALRGYAPVGPGAETEQVIVFARGAWPAYAWSFPIGDGRANIGYGQVLGAGRPPSRAELVGRLDELLPGVTAGATGWRGHHLPLSSSRPRQPDGRVLLAGDAASLVNPITGEGIYYAVLSGALAGAAAVDRRDDVTPGTRYRRTLEAALGRHLRHTAFAARLARHPGVVNAAVRSAADDARVFDDLVEVGLGRGRLTPRVLRGIGTRLVSRL